MSSSLDPGLYLVSTPIGNLGDITVRALEILGNADRILCEDTRVTAKLLRRYEISVPIGVYNDQSDEQDRRRILDSISDGEAFALVSDAGTPLISDPGFKLVRAVIAEGLPVTSVPGPSAVVTALSLAGIPVYPFYFGGFLPTRRAQRRKALKSVAHLDATLVFYETPGRLRRTLDDVIEMLGDREGAVVREATKLHEQVVRGRLSELRDASGHTMPVRGEAVLVIAPPGEESAVTSAEVEEMILKSLKIMSLSQAAKTVADETGLPRSELYNLALELGERRGTDDA